MPGETDGDHGYQDRAGGGEVSPTVCRIQAIENRSDLQADEDKREYVQREDDRLPHRVGLYAVSRGNSLWGCPRHGDRVTYHGEHAGEPDVLGKDPYAERAHELENDR